MSGRTAESHEYREQLLRLGRALATGRPAEARAALDPASSLEELQRFFESNVEKRLDKLRRQLDFVAAAFGDFEDLLSTFVHKAPLAAYASADTDADRFLAWVMRRGGLTPEQRDHIACQRARHAVEAKARINRLAHTHFQELCSAAARLAPELGVNSGLHIHLNPNHARARFVTPALLEGEATPPAEVIFFAHGAEVSVAVLERLGRRVVRELGPRSPVTLDGWLAGGTRVGRDDLIACCTDLAETGLVAFS